MTLTTTPFCPNGGQAKTGTPIALWLQGSTLCTMLGGVWAPWATAVCDIGVILLINFGDFCSQPPPDPPASPFDNLGTTGILPTPNAVADWLVAVWKSQYWTTYCECKTVNGCPPQTGTHSWTTPTTAALAEPTSSSVILPIPSGATQVSFTDTNRSASNGWVMKWNVVAAGGAQTAWGNCGYLNAGASCSAGPMTIPGGYTSIALLLQRNHNGSIETGTMDYTVTWGGPCTPAPGPVWTPPPAPARPSEPAPPAVVTGCTTDDICARVQHLEQMLSIVSTEVDETYLWTQSFTGGSGGISTTYRLGTVHTGITGSGVLTVASGILGLLVSVTAHPSSAGMEPGSPSSYFGIGHLTPGTADGWDRSIQLRKLQQLIYNRLQPWTQVGYSLQPGVTVTVTELIPA